MRALRVNALLRWSALVVLFLPGFAFADYLKINPPPDVNKDEINEAAACWLATAANMLAGAGYGTGATVQARAEAIFEQLKASELTATYV